MILKMASGSEMVADVAICQYVADPFRHESRNIGVISRVNGTFVSRFLGERDDIIDGRSAPFINDINAYKQWVKHWKKVCARSEDDWKEKLFRTGKSNYFVIDGGQLTNVDGSSTEAIIDYFVRDLGCA